MLCCSRQPPSRSIELMPKRQPQQKPVMSRATKALIVLQVLTVLALLWFKGGQLF